MPVFEMTEPVLSMQDLITALEHDEWIFIPAAGGRYLPRHPAFIRNWSIAMLEAFIRHGRIYHAKRTRKTEETLCLNLKQS